MLDFTKYQYLSESGRRIFFIGIGGISMCGLAELAHSHGQIVAGSDLKSNARTQYLEGLGIQIGTPQQAQHIDSFQPDAVVFSAAVAPTNPERLRAGELGIPEIERSDWLGLVNRGFERVINIAGTNGKSTTTALCSLMLVEAKQDPTVHLGAELKDFGSTIRIGEKRNVMVSEACEFHYSFLSFFSTTATVLNLGHDHVDCFPTFKDVIAAFARFVCTLEPGDNLIVPAFDPAIPEMLEMAYQQKAELRDRLNLCSFGTEEDRFGEAVPTLYCQNISYEQGFPHFELIYQGQSLGYFDMAIPGRFNIDNAMAALAAALLNGADIESCRRVLARFRGAEGRFTVTGKFNGATIVADYAHHPDSVKLTLEAARNFPHKRLIAGFQPITYSRARGLCQGYIEAMALADIALIQEVYDNRETDHSFSAAKISDGLKELDRESYFFADGKALEGYLRQEVREGDLVILMGQDIREIADHLSGRVDHFSDAPGS